MSLTNSKLNYLNQTELFFNFIFSTSQYYIVRFSIPHSDTNIATNKLHTNINTYIFAEPKLHTKLHP